MSKNINIKKCKYFIILIVLIFVCLSTLKSQTNLSSDNLFFKKNEIGIPFSAFFSNNSLVDKQIFSIVQDTIGNYFMANRRGIILFDSKEYKFIPVSGIPYRLLFNPMDNTIYLVCNNSVGYIEYSEAKKKYLYQKIASVQEKSFNNIKILYTNEQVIFYSNNAIIFFNIKDNTTYTLESKTAEGFMGIVEYNSEKYILSANNVFQKLDHNGLSTGTTLKSQTKINEVNYYVKLKSQSLFCTYPENDLYIIKDEKINKVVDKSLSYLKDKEISGMLALDTSIIAISMLNGGVVFFNINDQKITSILNNLSGLSDNEVFCIYKDNNNDFVISNNYGLHVYCLNMPIYNYSSFIGLEGNIMNVHKIDTTLYVLTSQGLYYLTRAKSEEEFIEVISKTKTIYRTNIKTVIKYKDRNDDSEEINKKNKKGRLRKWVNGIFNKNNNDVEKIDTHTKSSTHNQISIDSSATSLIRYNKHRLTNFTELYYIYKKVENINVKCKQSIEYNDKLIVATNNGVFIVYEKTSNQLLRGEYITKISKSTVDSNLIYVATIKKLYKLTFEGDKPILKSILDIDKVEDLIISITDTESDIWLGGEGYAYKISKNNFKNIKSYSLSPNFLSVVEIKKLGTKIEFFIPQGIYKYHSGLDSIVNMVEFSNTANSTYFVNNQLDYIWTIKNDVVVCNGNNIEINDTVFTFLKLIPNISNITVDKNSDLWVISNDNMIYKIDQENVNKYKFHKLKFHIDSINILDSSFVTKKISIKYKEDLKADFYFNCPYFVSEKNIYYEYCATSDSSDIVWTKITNENNFESILKLGENSFYFRAKNILGQTSNIQHIVIDVRPMFYQTEWFKLLIFIIVIILLVFIGYVRQKYLVRQNKKLEKNVKERTEIINKQKEKLKATNEAINIKNEKLVLHQNSINEHRKALISQKKELKKSNFDITQSINYARRIQKAMLPKDNLLSTAFPEYFILSKPKDIVSGDFYWYKKYQNKHFLSVADCTGHGVPGAFLSMLGTAYLNEIITYKDNIKASEILDALRQNVIDSLQEQANNDIRDGMDMAIIIIDKKQRTIQFSGAYNPIYIYSNSKLNVTKADRMTVGFSRKNDIPFSNKVIKYNEGDIIYLFSDGYIDQFGGKVGRKLLSENFKKIISKIADMKLSEQKEMLSEFIDNWKGDNFQLDDITVVGVKLD